MSRTICALSIVVLLSSFAFADTLSGTVTNGTTGKPAAGDKVTLLRLSQGMDEEATTKTDPQGHYKFETDTSVPHLVRANHGGVNYHQPAPPGSGSADVQVYDSASKLESVSVTADVMRFQGDPNQLNVVELFAIQNDSKPPRTQMSDHGSFDFYLPEGAQVESAIASTQNGMPLNLSPAPLKQKGRYTFIFPLRPGETRFQVSYHLPYSGQATIQPRLLAPVQHLVVMLPKSMQFSSRQQSRFESGEDEGMNLYVATAAKAGEELGFQVSGRGELPREAQNGGAESGQQAANRPGGGLGAPIEAPDALQKYKWYILGGLAVALGIGAFFLLGKPRPAASAVAASAENPQPAARPRTATAGVGRAARGALAASVPANGDRPGDGNVFEAIKEELFELESDRLQGRLSAEDYRKYKAALDLTLERALSRKKES